MHTKIVLIGAGSAQFGLGTLSDIFVSQVLPGSEVMLHDINPQAPERVQKAAGKYVKDHDLNYTITATTDPNTALKNAQFAIISIEIGDRFALWEQDWMIPLQYGIRQVYGENGGPGGLFHALRIIPPILEICGDIQTICPDAHVFNFSNPMTRICTTVQRKYPDLHFLGLCYEIASLPQHLPKILEVPLENLSYTAGGLNHFSVLLDVRYKDTGEDAYPDLRKKAPPYFDQLPYRYADLAALRDEQAGSTPGAESALREGAHPWPERWLFKEILETFDYMPITEDSHFGEYIPWAQDTVDHQGILDFYNHYKANCQVSEARLGPPTKWERVIPMIEGVLTDSGQKEHAVNVRNDGFIDDLPGYIAVEVPATVDKDGVHGVKLGALPKGITGLLLNQAAVNDLTAEAILQKSKNLALQALLVDPVVHSAKAAKQTLDMMLKLQKKHLGYLK